MPDYAEIKFEGHLTAEKLNAAVPPVNEMMEKTSDKIALVIDCTAMTGYESAARVAFVDWNRKHKANIRRVAVITPNKLWHMVVAAMSLATGQPMQAFDDRARASEWLLQR